MTATLMPLVKQQFNQNGVPVSGGKLFVYLAGTTTKATSFTDSTGQVPNTNPVILDANGQASVWLDPSTYYKLILSPPTDTDPPTNPYWTVDNVISPVPVAVGNMTDEKGSGGNPGFAAGVDFVAGTTTSLTLSRNYGSASNLWIAFDAAEQGADSFTLNGTTLTFNAPIPLGTNKVYVKGGTSLSVGTPGAGTVVDASIAIGTKLYDRITATVDVRDPPFGATWTGANGTDDTAALQLAVNSFGGKPGVVFLPPGTGNISSTISIPAGVSIVGSGVESTTIVPLTAGMTIFQQHFATNSGSNSKVSNLNINCGAIANVVGFDFVYCNRMDLENINFFGCQYNFKYDRGGLNRIINCLSAPSATQPAGQILMWSSTDTEYGFVYSVLENYRIEGGSLGVQSPAVYFRRAVGVKASIITNNSNGTGYGMIIENDCQGIDIHDSIFVGFNVGAVFQTGGGVNVPPTFNTFSNVDFDQNTSNEIIIANGVNNTFIGGMITASAVGTSQKAVELIGQNAAQNLFQGVTISGYNGAGGEGVSLTNTSSNMFIGCKITNCRNGFSFDDTNNVNTRIIDCDLSVNVTTPINGSPANAGNEVRGNKGYIPANAIATPAMISSGGTITNNYGVPARIFVTGGTISSLSINGVTATFSGGMILLNPGEILSMTYTGSPSWGWIGA